MTKTIQEALAPILIIGSFCSLSYLEYPFGRPRPYLTCLYFLVKWSLFMYLFYYVIYSSHTAFIYFTLMSKLQIFFVIMSIIVSLYRFKELKLCLHKLSIVDDTLEILGTPKEYQWLRNWAIRVIIMWSIIICFTNISDSFSLNYDYFSITRIFAPFVGNHLHHINVFSTLMWGLIYGYVSSRFQRINELLPNLLENKTKYIEQENLISNGQRRTKVKECRQYMWTITHVHLQLCFISRQLNKVFSIQMTLQVAFTFICFVEELCMIYTSHIMKTKTFGDTLDTIFIHIWMAIRSIKFLVLNHICQTVYDKANEAIAILYKLSNENPEEDLQEQILQFILQIKHRKIRFSGMGLFYFGYNFTRKFCASIATVVVIILQMHITFKYDDLPLPTTKVK